MILHPVPIVPSLNIIIQMGNAHVEDQSVIGGSGIMAVLKVRSADIIYSIIQNRLYELHHTLSIHRARTTPIALCNHLPH